MCLNTRETFLKKTRQIHFTHDISRLWHAWVYSGLTRCLALARQGLISKTDDNDQEIFYYDILFNKVISAFEPENAY